MSISTDWEIKNIKEYAELLKKEYELKEKLREINDELINLLVCMTKNDINDAYTLFEKLMESEC